MVELRQISEDNFQQCLKVHASVQDDSFVDSVEYSLAEAWVYYQETRPFAIYNSGTIIGFVSIDDAFQGKGLGTQAAKLCIEYLKNEFAARRISVPVNLENVAAKKFWEKQGFCLSDTIEDGYIFMRRW